MNKILSGIRQDIEILAKTGLLKQNVIEKIAIISDGTCETAENYVRAILAQFKMAKGQLLRYPRIRSAAEINRILDSVQAPFLFAYTFATEKLRKHMWAECKRRKLLGVDILYPALEIFSDFLKAAPTESQGILHSMQANDYFERIEALEFTVKHDDGMKMASIHEADIILTGVSRTSKTPTSMYLAHRGLKVANIPLVPNISTPRPLLDAKQHSIPVIFLTIDAQYLARIRRTRIERMNASARQDDHYSDQRIIQEELLAAERLAREQQWPIIDVTNKAVEETAAEILLLVSQKSS